MRVLVTGGAGFIGSHVAGAVMAAGHEAAVLDNLAVGKRENVPAKARLFEVDLRDRDGVRQAFREFRPDVVSHHAAQASVAVSVREPVMDAEVNVMGSINVLDAAREFAVRRVVFASTGGAIYGEVAEGSRAQSSWPPHPESPYACAKFAVEEYLRMYRHHFGLETVTLRYANVYGPRQDPFGEAGVVAIFLGRILAGQMIQINAMKTMGDAGCVRDYVYVEDVARANVTAVEGRCPRPVLNVCTGRGTSTLTLATMLEELVGRKVERSFGPKRAGDLERSVLDPEGLDQVIGPLTDLRTGLALTAQWFQSKGATPAR